MRGLEILGNHTEEELHMKLPALILEAKGIVEFENKMAKPSILAEYTQAKEQQKSMPQIDQDDDEVAIMDTFIAKAGRKLLRKSLLAAAGKTDESSDFGENDASESDTLQNPNAHASLFLKPSLPSRQSFLDIVRSEKLLASQEEKFSLMSLQNSKNLSVSKSASESFLPKLKHFDNKKIEPIRYNITKKNSNKQKI